MKQISSSLSEMISGYQLAEHLLSEGGVGALIRYAGNSETDWLELKAGMSLLPEDRKKGETDKDLYWNIAKEVVALMNTSGGALVIGIHDKTLEVVPLENNDPGHVLAEKGIDGYVREFVRAKVWPNSLSWSYRGKICELADKQLPTDLISYHHAPYSGPDGRSSEVVVLLVKPSEKVHLVKEDRKYSVLLKRARGAVGEATSIYDYDAIETYKMSREIESKLYANICNQFDKDQATASESAKINAAIKNYYNDFAAKAKKTMAVFTSLDAEENVLSTDDADQFYSPGAIEYFDEEDCWLEDDAEKEEADGDGREGDEKTACDEDSDDDSLDSENDAEDGYDERPARRGDLLELLQSEQRVIVFGEPGGGKTTCLKYFTLKYAESENAASVLAVFIPMGQWRRGGSLSLMMERATNLNSVQIAQLMLENRIRLVIDAVNECPDDFRVAAIYNIGMYLTEHPTVPAVISTRNPEELSALHLPVFHVQPLDEVHRLHYLERYLKDADQAQKLLLQLDSMPGGETVAENPMLLKLVVDVYRKSPEKRLPNGRAGLYRSSLRGWRKREEAKVKNSGESLRWSKQQIFELLETLAFRSRQLGYRDIPLEKLCDIWGDDAEKRLEALCQGPIVFCDNEFVRFRHETFQEYLCAEYLVAHQDELPTWAQEDYSRWGMPFAYAVELFELDRQQLPESLWLASWNLNPWLGVALTNDQQGRQLLRSHYHGRRPMVAGKPLDIRLKAVYLRAVCGTLNNSRHLRWALRDKIYPWYRCDDVALRYVVSVSSTCQRRWRRFEEQQLLFLKGMRIRQAIKLSKNWLTFANPRDIFQFHAPKVWNGWIANSTPEEAIALVKANIALPSDFHDVKKQWVAGMGLKRYCCLAKAQILQPSDICEKISQWVATATPETAISMIDSGLVPRSKFDDKIHKWCETATPESAMSMIELGLVPRSVFDEQIRKWCESATPELAAVMMKSGLASRSMFEDKIHKWCESATPESAISMLDIGVVMKDDLVAQIQCWIRNASCYSACLLIQNGLAQVADFEDKVVHAWSEMATPDIACMLIDAGLACSGDFTKKLPLWLTDSQYLFVRKFIRRYEVDLTNGLCIDDALVRHWIEIADMDSAISLLHDDLAKREDFKKRAEFWADFSEIKKLWGMATVGLITQGVAALRAEVDRKIKLALASHRMPSAEEKQQWLSYCNFNSLVEMLNAGLVFRDDALDRINCWKDNASPQMACALVSANLAQPVDFRSRVGKWKSLLSLKCALSLLKSNIMDNEEISVFKKVWRKNIAPDTLSSAVQLGCLKVDEARRYLSLWGDAVPAEDRRRIMQDRFVVESESDKCDFLKEFPPDAFRGPDREQLYRILTGFQHANLIGDPDLASALAGQYRLMRPHILALDRELCAYADLKLAVYERDAFEFNKALLLADEWNGGTLFASLSARGRGRLFDSRGQSLASMGRNNEAEAAFLSALDAFSAEPKPVAVDIEQARIHRAMNALDYNALSAVPILVDILGKPLVAAAREFAIILEKPFVAHLFLKLVWRLREEQSDAVDALLKNLPVNFSLEQRHPNELISFYLALLTKDIAPSYAQARVKEAEEFFGVIEYGGTLGLVHSYVRVMLKRQGVNIASDRDFFDELDIVEKYLPNARTIINTLRAGWMDSAAFAEGTLPFNFC